MDLNLETLIYPAEEYLKGRFNRHYEITETSSRNISFLNITVVIKNQIAKKIK